MFVTLTFSWFCTRPFGGHGLYVLSGHYTNGCDARDCLHETQQKEADASRCHTRGVTWQR